MMLLKDLSSLFPECRRVPLNKCSLLNPLMRLVARFVWESEYVDQRDPKLIFLATVVFDNGEF